MAVVNKARIQANIRNSELANSQISAVTSEELMQAMQSQAGGNSQAPASGAARQLLQNVKATSSIILGSNEERSVILRQLNSVTSYQGFPHLWMTYSMPDKRTLLVSTYSGALDSRVMFNYLNQNRSHDSMPRMDLPPGVTESKLVYANSGDASACARHFDRIINIIIEVAFGIELTTGMCKETGGLYGFAKNYFIVVESQASLTLHGHCLVWLHGPMPTAAASRARIEDPVRGPEWTNAITAFMDSISTYVIFTRMCVQNGTNIFD